MSHNLLQKRVNELNSAILNYSGTKVYTLGFNNEGRLRSHLDKNKDNWNSKGMYDNSKITFSTIKNNALFIVMVDGEVVEKHKFSVYRRETVQRINDPGPLIMTFRKHEFIEQWQILVLKQIYSFSSKKEMESFLIANYRFDFEI